MQNRQTIKTIAFIELLIGVSTILGLAGSSLFGLPGKPANVFIFVLLSAITSATIGAGLLAHKQWARTLLVFFSGYIIITKILIFSDLLHFSGEMITFVSAGVKNLISVGYHSFVIVFFARRDVRVYFYGPSE